MAFLEKRNGRFRLKIHFQGRYYSRSLKTSNEQKAALAKGQAERNLELVSLGLLKVPNECDVFEFFLTGQASVSKPEREPRKKPPVSLSIGRLFQLYFDAFLKESIEANSFKMLQTHRNNLVRLLGEKTTVSSFGSGNVQKYVDDRAKEKGRRGRIQPVTIRKEVTTLSAIFRWAVDNGHTKGIPSTRGIRYPKGKEKPPFQTWQEIERKVARGGLSEDDVSELWECLFLSTDQIDELLRYVKQNSRHGFIYPAFAFAAHTGARRSEIARCQISDIDLASATITIREKKRVRGMTSTRRVPMSPFLRSLLSEWLDNHPGGQMTFCLEADVCRSKKERAVGSIVTKDELHDHFTRTITDSKWQVLHGWHTLRHSFCSNCAAAGVEQRVINEWVGHQTEEMVRRYRHLFPNKQQQAIQSVFGSPSS